MRLEDLEIGKNYSLGRNDIAEYKGFDHNLEAVLFKPVQDCGTYLKFEDGSFGIYGPVEQLIIHQV